MQPKKDERPILAFAGRELPEQVPAGRKVASVAILVPHGENVKSEFAWALRGLQVPPGTKLIGTTRRPLDFARNSLVRQGLASGADWFLWLDSDMAPPSDTVQRLMAHRFPFVSALYYTREHDRSKAAAYVRAPDVPGHYRSIVPPREPELLEVDGVGFGCVLTHRSLFEKSKAPWFDFPITDDGDGILGEDFFFCEKAIREAGHAPFVDTSLRVGHSWTHVQMPLTHDEELAKGGLLDEVKQ